MRHYVYVYRLPGISFCANSEIHTMLYPAGYHVHDSFQLRVLAGMEG